eukprot:206455-Rhodomonas_salina.3
MSGTDVVYAAVPYAVLIQRLTDIAYGATSGAKQGGCPRSPPLSPYAFICAIILCYPPTLSFALSSYAIILRYHPMLSSYAISLRYHSTLSFSAITLRYRSALSSYAFIRITLQHQSTLSPYVAT